MSRWLKSVNSLLEQLDGQVETAVEEHDLLRDNDEDTTIPEQENAMVENILAKRGYSSHHHVVPEEEGEEQQVQLDDNVGVLLAETNDEQTIADVGAQEKDAAMVVEQVKKNETTWEAASDADATDEHVQVNQVASQESTETLVAGMKSVSVVEDAEQQTDEAVSSRAFDTEEEALQDIQLDEEEATNVIGEETVVSDPPIDDCQGDVDIATINVPDEALATGRPREKDITVPVSAPLVEKAHPLTGDSITTAAPSTQAVSEQEYKRAVTEVHQVQKECRTLRRHVVSLNSELEAAEAEIQAQRTELERAAERMEKDRCRQKEERDRLAVRHAEEVKALKLQHEQTVADLKSRSDQQLEDARKRMKEMEERRMQEGGDWTKEMEQTLQREQDSVRRMANLEDEKSTLLSQISSLQAQQTALENRLGSVSQTADNAMEREREAEDRLDAALSIHARQLTQRQARESELERTVADLGAALVVARNKEVSRLKSESGDRTAGDRGGNDVSALRARLEESEDHLETLKAQLDLERQRSKTSQQELQDMSKERTEEASAAHARQLQSDRKLADMSVTLSRLQASVRDTKKFSSFNERDSGFSSDDDNRSSQIKSLSEQVLKQQETIARGRSEISALKNRLQVAVGRAENAEEALSLAHDSDDVYDRMERAPLSGASDGGLRSMRRRGGRASNSGNAVSIRSAIHMNPGQGQNGEKIGKAIDAVDSFSVQTGKYLRSNPLARAGFLLYLLLIHIWTFVIIIFHAHGFETVHGDFGAGHQVSHGPHALMQGHEPSGASP